MKYTNSIEIRLPRDQVAKLLADPAHLPKWLRGMVIHEPTDGVHGQLGARSRVVMQSGEREFEACETISRREPEDLNLISDGVAVHLEREIKAFAAHGHDVRRG
ncbi:SRPBCC family protein [Gordonia terrae]